MANNADEMETRVAENILSVEEDAIRKCEDARFRAVVDADIATLDGLFTNGLVYTHSTGIVDTKAAYLEAIRSGALDYSNARYDLESIVKLHNQCDVYLSLGQVTMDVKVNGEDRHLKNRGNGVWIKEDGRFRLAAFAATPIRSVT